MENYKLNELEKIVLKYSPNNEDLDFDDWEIDYYWSKISSNPSISINFILENKHLNWDWISISSNPNITIEFIESNMDLPWDWNGLSLNPNINMNFINKYYDKPWNWGCISANPNITIHTIEKYPNKEWVWKDISYNKNINIEYIKKNIEKNWSWTAISSNPNITMDNIKQNMNLPWNWDSILYNPNLTLDFCIEFKEEFYLKIKRSPWNDVAIKSNTTLDIIINNPKFPWELTNFGCNPNITIDFINTQIYKEKIETNQKYYNLFWKYLSKNKNITMDIIEKYIDENWNWYEIYQNNLYFTINYYKQRKLKTIQNTQIYNEELFGITWQPHRFKDWCLDNEEKEELNERWN